MARPVVSRRMGTWTASHSRPRLLRSGQRQSVHAATVHDRIQQKRRNRLGIKECGSEKLIHDQIQKRIGIRRKIIIRISDQIIKPKRTHGRHKVFDILGQQTGIIVCKILFRQILVSKVICREYRKIQRLIFVRDLNRVLLSKIVLWRQPVIVIVDNVLKARWR